MCIYSVAALLHTNNIYVHVYSIVRCEIKKYLRLQEKIKRVGRGKDQEFRTIYYFIGGEVYNYGAGVGELTLNGWLYCTRYSSAFFVARTLTG